MNILKTAFAQNSIRAKQHSRKTAFAQNSIRAKQLKRVIIPFITLTLFLLIWSSNMQYIYAEGTSIGPCYSRCTSNVREATDYVVVNGCSVQVRYEIQACHNLSPTGWYYNIRIVSIHIPTGPECDDINDMVEEAELGDPYAYFEFKRAMYDSIFSMHYSNNHSDPEPD